MSIHPMAGVRILKKLNFWRKARNRHGVHSPFIYDFLDKGLYRKDLKSLPPQQRLLIAAADHFNPVTAGTCDLQSPMAAWLGSQRPHLLWGSPPTDLFICDSPGKNLIAFIEGRDTWGNDTVVFVGNVRKNQETYACWSRAISHPAVRVILETYPAGLLFFRTQQARQHFRIRI